MVQPINEEREQPFDQSTRLMKKREGGTDRSADKRDKPKGRHVQFYKS
jgi:hypothetical protein